MSRNWFLFLIHSICLILHIKLIKSISKCLPNCESKDGLAQMNCIRSRTLVKSALQFCVSQPNYMLWVLKRTVSLRPKHILN